MNCKNKKVDKWLGWLILGLGVISFLYGLLTFIIVQPEGKSANTLMGMFTGFGFGIMLVGLRTAIHNKRTPNDKLEQEEIERNDERNIAIARAAGTVSMIAGMTIFAVLAFVFMGMGLILPSYLSLAGLYVMGITAKIAQKILETKM